MSLESDDALYEERQSWYREAGINQLPPRVPQVLHALTLWQPWATLMAIGAKRIETRSWPCPAWLIGKPLAIHAAKTPPAGYRDYCREPDFLLALKGAGYLTPDELPMGAVVAVVRVTACDPTERIVAWADLRLRGDEVHFGDYSPGRFGWETELLHRFEEPVPALGRQGIWKFQLPAPWKLEDFSGV